MDSRRRRRVGPDRQGAGAHAAGAAGSGARRRIDRVELERPRLYEFETVTGNRSTWQYRFEPDGTGTRVTLRVDYDVPQNQLARFATEGTLKAMNENRAAEVLANLKGLVED